MGGFKERALGWLGRKLLVIGAGHPYKHLCHEDGRPYMRRYWLLKLGRGAVVDGEVMPRWLGVRLHMICSSDDDRAYHDHPWWFCTIILRGGYLEHRPRRPTMGLQSDAAWPDVDRARWHGPGSILFRRARDWHRLELPEGKTAVTLFIHGPRHQKWGFLQAGAGKVPYDQFETGVRLAPAPRGQA